MEKLELLEARRKYSLEFTDEKGSAFNAVVETDTNGTRHIMFLQVDGIVHKESLRPELRKKVLDKFEELLL